MISFTLTVSQYVAHVYHVHISYVCDIHLYSKQVLLFWYLLLSLLFVCCCCAHFKEGVAFALIFHSLTVSVLVCTARAVEFSSSLYELLGDICCGWV